jgi:hypothetical protein
MEKNNRIELEVPIEGCKRPARISAKISDEELELLMKYQDEGMPDWEAYQKMRKTFPVPRLGEDRL